ncbi:MAG: hypothetical protein H6Q02_1361 [Acidobacteria bacterium]|nr:hypothetical protein [Acidobacteriota bacterium]
MKHVHARHATRTAEWPAGSARFAQDVQSKTPPTDTVALTGLLAAVLQRAVERDSTLRAGWIALQRSGVALQIRLEPGGAGVPPRIVVEATRAGVPQWSSEDREVLRSLGIASDDDENSGSGEPGWREPR